MAEETDYNPREHMEQVIAAGGSVYHKGAIISNKDQLPSQAELAKGDKAAEATARAALQRHRDAIDAEIAQLDSNPPAAAKSDAKPDAKKDDSSKK